MKNETLKTAIKLDFDYENSTFETKEELEQKIVDFLNEQSKFLPKLKDYCEVHGSGNKQYVSFGDYNCSGEIIQYDRFARKHRIYHSNFLYIDETGKCFEQLLYDYSK